MKKKKSFHLDMHACQFIIMILLLYGGENFLLRLTLSLLGCCESFVSNLSLFKKYKNENFPANKTTSKNQKQQRNFSIPFSRDVRVMVWKLCCKNSCLLCIKCLCCLWLREWNSKTFLSALTCELVHLKIWVRFLLKLTEILVISNCFFNEIALKRFLDCSKWKFCTLNCIKI